MDRIRVEENGNLYIAKLASSDQGRYTCVALNIVGTRETPPALLTVHGELLFLGVASTVNSSLRNRS